MKAAAMKTASEIYNLFYCFMDHNSFMLVFPQWKIVSLINCANVLTLIWDNPSPTTTKCRPLYPSFSLIWVMLFCVAPSCEIGSRIPNKTRKDSTTLAAPLFVVSSSGLTGGMIIFSSFWSPRQHLDVSCWNDLTLYEKDSSFNAE